MPHIDDGTLHAALDGALRAMEPAEADAVQAHLEGCAECRARLEEAAALRGRAGEILGVLEPAVAPDFEEVLVRAGAGAAGGAAAGGSPGRSERIRRQMGWTRGLAWAATLVIALGTGYVIRDRLGPEGTSAVMQSATDRGRSSAAESAQGSAGTDREGVAADGGAATPVATQEQERAPTAGREPPPEGPVREEAVGNRTAERAPLVEGDAAARRALAESAGVTAEAGVRTDPPAILSAHPPEPRLESATPAEALKMTDAVTAPAAFVAMSPPDTAGLQLAAPAAVRDLAGTPLAVIPGAEVEQVWVAAAPASRIVSTQRLEDGAVVRVVQQPSVIALDAIVVTGAAADEERRPRQSAARPRPQEAEAIAAAPSPPAPAPAESLQPGMNRVRTGGIIGYELILEGPLPRDRLEALARAAQEAWLRATLVRPDP